MIGADFEKIQFTLFGLNLVEPMGFITDMIMGGISFYLAYRCSSIKSNLAFYTYWKWFFLTFGFGAITGGFGHLLYNYWSIAGKFPSWLSGPITVYCIEQAMISIHPIEKRLNLFKLISTLKLMLVFVVFGLMFVFFDVNTKPELPFLPVAINTILGVILSAGLLGGLYSKVISKKFRFIYYGVLIMVPSAFVFLLKINLHPWFDKNDLSHVMLTAGIIFFYLGVKKISEGLSTKA